MPTLPDSTMRNLVLVVIACSGLCAVLELFNFESALSLLIVVLNVAVVGLGLYMVRPKSWRRERG